jgi:putative intracellular protease/amidase
MPKSVLLLCSNPAMSPVTGWPIGFWWAELTHAFEVFEEAGFAITIASPRGGAIAGDGYSDPDDPSGYSAHDSVSRAFKQDAARMALLEDTPSLADINADSFDAIFVVGGQGPMVTMIDDQRVHDLFARFYETGRIASAVCHGTCILLRTRLSSGDLLITGKRWTGFANSEEEYAESAVGQKIQPFWIETEARALADTYYECGEALSEFAIADGRLITGQQQNSSAAAARLVVAALAG